MESKIKGKHEGPHFTHYQCVDLKAIKGKTIDIRLGPEPSTGRNNNSIEASHSSASNSSKGSGSRRNSLDDAQTSTGKDDSNSPKKNRVIMKGRFEVEDSSHQSVNQSAHSLQNSNMVEADEKSAFDHKTSPFATFILHDHKKSHHQKLLQTFQPKKSFANNWHHLGKASKERPSPQLQPLANVRRRTSQKKSSGGGKDLTKSLSSETKGLTRRAITALLQSGSKKRGADTDYILHMILLACRDNFEERACLLAHIAFSIALPEALSIGEHTPIPQIFVPNPNSHILTKKPFRPLIKRILLTAIYMKHCHLLEMLLSLPIINANDPIFGRPGKKSLFPTWLACAASVGLVGTVKYMLSNCTPNGFQNKYKYLGILDYLFISCQNPHNQICNKNSRDSSGNDVAADEALLGKCSRNSWLLSRIFIKMGVTSSGISSEDMKKLQKFATYGRISRQRAETLSEPPQSKSSKNRIPSINNAKAAKNRAYNLNDAKMSSGRILLKQPIFPIDCAVYFGYFDLFSLYKSNDKHAVDKMLDRNTFTMLSPHLNLDIAIALLQANTSLPLDQMDLHGNTPLHLVAQQSNPKLLTVILYTAIKRDQNLDAFIDVVNNFGDTALHLATYNANTECMRILIKYGASCSICNADNKTVLECALDSGISNDQLCEWFGQDTDDPEADLVDQLERLQIDLTSITHKNGREKRKPWKRRFFIEKIFSFPKHFFS